MKKIVFVFSLFAITFLTSAQSKSSADAGFTFGGGLRLALPLGDFNKTHSFGIGAEVQGEYLFTPAISATLTTGYTSFIGKTYDLGSYSLKAPAFGYVPVLAGIRFYAAPSFFIGGKAGLGFTSFSGESTSAFNYEPQVGFNGEKFQLAVGYNALTKNSATTAHLGLSAMFKF